MTPISFLPANDNDGDDFPCDAEIVEIVEQNLADMFVYECWELAEELGMDAPLTPEQEAELNAEFDDRHKLGLIKLHQSDRRKF
jgi:hypothetical protein